MVWFGVVRGHPRSSPMSPFDRAHTISYSSLIETMRLSCTIFEIQLVICRNSPTLPYPTSIWRPRWGWPRSNFEKKIWRHKTRVPGLSCGFGCVFLCLAILVEHQLVTDGQTDTDTQTQGHGIYRESKARAVKMKQIKHCNNTFPGDFKDVFFVKLPLKASQIRHPNDHISVDLKSQNIKTAKYDLNVLLYLTTISMMTMMLETQFSSVSQMVLVLVLMHLHVSPVSYTHLTLPTNREV